MSIHQSEQYKKQPQQEEKAKKLFMKIILNGLRKFFNMNELPYHPLITCVSIKPGCINRCASLQSYPNQSVWKSLVDLPKEMQQEVVEFLIKELDAKSIKFQSKFLIESQERIRNNFDFQSFYKEPTKFEIPSNDKQSEFQKDADKEIKDDGTKIKQKKWFKGEDFVSESKQIATQMKLCNQHPPLVEVSSFHFHKMRCLLEKIKEQKFKQSEEMKIFVEELEKFIQNDPKAEEHKKKRKIKKYNDKKNHQHDDEELIQGQITLQREVKVEDNSAQDFLDQFKLKVKKIEPGIVLYLPQYYKILPKYREYCKSLEDSYFKNLYYLVQVGELILNSQDILKFLRQVFKNLDFWVPYEQKSEIPTK
ncbi:unnamed protein product (macronuclear) [Paramecium tetraurelia]|uniref:Uncharacterized protein n=1 Tax=Paramecium tetraurelia TaxID=5888 RepID=A0E4I1_PARTE|nr:uncharacterized protein GSPATT00023373001 [Paramecium tetraurelia]CAK90198.1 unnamed protein product [Paramecium tetraurelia]|eukprot:XP_001457595.1 hypothetical protein (macronuclear) [Paramecium tetraurelia strain d4-2]